MKGSSARGLDPRDGDGDGGGADDDRDATSPSILTDDDEILLLLIYSKQTKAGRGVRAKPERYNSPRHAYIKGNVCVFPSNPSAAFKRLALFSLSLSRCSSVSFGSRARLAGTISLRRELFLLVIKDPTSNGAKTAHGRAQSPLLLFFYRAFYTRRSTTTPTTGEPKEPEPTAQQPAIRLMTSHDLKRLSAQMALGIRKPQCGGGDGGGARS